MTLLFIPARGGSKGIPFKNLHPFLGKPLIYYTFRIVEQMMRNYPNQLIPFLSTDDEKILSFGKENGLDNDYIRPNWLSGDKASIIDGILDALDWLKLHRNLAPDQILVLQPTSPLRTIEQVTQLFKDFSEKNAVSMFSVIPMWQHPYECIHASEDDWDYLITPPKSTNQRQSYESSYYFIDGAFYLVTTEFLKANRALVARKISIPFIINDPYMVDIDEPEDLKMAEAVMTYRTIGK